MTGSDVPAPLISAFWRDLVATEPELRERTWFLRRVAEGAAGPVPPMDEPDPTGASEGVHDRVPLAEGVALALAVVEQFDGPVEDDPGTAPPPPGPPALSGRVVARELVRRARRRLPGGQR